MIKKKMTKPYDAYKIKKIPDISIPRILISVHILNSFYEPISLVTFLLVTKNIYMDIFKCFPYSIMET